MFTPQLRFLLAAAFALVSFGYLDLAPKAEAIARPDGWVHPVAASDVLQDYWSPNGDFSAGHRGVDYPSFEGEPVFAVADGVVRFAGQVAGRGVVSITLTNSFVAEVEPVCPSVAEGDQVFAGQQIGTQCGQSTHCDVACLHLSARKFSTDFARGFAYVSPLIFLGEFSSSHLVAIGSLD